MDRNVANLPSPTLAEAVWRTAAYADVFAFPLTSAELHRYLVGLRASRGEVEQYLEYEKPLPQTGGYYTLPGREVLVALRRRREQVAQGLWAQALAYGRLIASLPFVRMLAVTGALARNNVDPGADIDYLLVTEPGRLWLCRLLALAIGRAARRRGVTLCPNYLVSLNALEFPDRTLYAAYELAQMVPLSGYDVYAKIREQNGWLKRFLPNAHGAPASPIPPFSPSPVSGATEAVLRLPAFNAVERWEMRRKISKLRRQQAASPESHFSADTCKGHDQRHQARTQAAFASRLGEISLVEWS